MSKMTEQLRDMLEGQTLRLNQLEKLSYTGRIAGELIAQVRELCHDLESAIATAEYLDTQVAVESELHAMFAA